MGLSEFESEHLRRAFKAAGPKVRQHLRPILPRSVVSFGDVELMVNPSDNFTEQFLWVNGRPPETRSLDQLKSLVSDKKALVLDIGANCGVYSVVLAKCAGQGSLITSFEPNPIMAARLYENLRRNALLDRVQVQGCALADKDGVLNLRLHERNFGESTLKVSDKAGYKDEIPVQTRPLVPYLDSVGDYDVSVLKIDVEGFEDTVLMPLFDASQGKNLPDAILIETAHAEQWQCDLVGRIKAEGYQATFKGEGNTLFKKQVSQR